MLLILFGRQNSVGEWVKDEEIEKVSEETKSLKAVLAQLSGMFDCLVLNLRTLVEAHGNEIDGHGEQGSAGGAESLSREFDEVILSLLEKQLFITKLIRNSNPGGGIPGSALLTASEESTDNSGLEIDQKIETLETKIEEIRERLGTKEEVFIAATDEADFGLSEDDRFEDLYLVTEPQESRFSLGELEQRVAKYRVSFPTSKSLRVKSASGSRDLSMHCFVVSNGAGNRVSFLDLESFVEVNKLALKGALRTLGAQGVEADPTDPSDVLERIQGFLLALHQDARSVYVSSGRGFLPDTQNAVTSDLLLNIEALLHLREWRTVEEVEEFYSIFQTRVEQPIKRLLSNTFERRRYLESILLAANHRDE